MPSLTKEDLKNEMTGKGLSLVLAAATGTDIVFQISEKCTL